jgi:hypothetical protein
VRAVHFIKVVLGGQLEYVLESEKLSVATKEKRGISDEANNNPEVTLARSLAHAHAHARTFSLSKWRMSRISRRVRFHCRSPVLALSSMIFLIATVWSASSVALLSLAALSLTRQKIHFLIEF